MARTLLEGLLIMRSIAVRIVATLLALSASARADEQHVRWAGDLELGAMASPSQGTRNDVAGLFTFQGHVRLPVAAQWELVLGLGIPMPPAISVQLPITISRRLGESGVRLHAGARGIYSFVDLCSTDTTNCPMEQALADPHDRGGYLFAVAGEVGASYEWAFSHGVALRVALSYLGGPAWGRRRNAETPISGYYQGGVMSIGVVTR